MLLRLLAAGTRMPHWVQEGYAEYATRLKGDFRLELVEIPLGPRTGGDPAKAIVKEGERMLAQLADKPYIVALQVRGKALSTQELADFLARRSTEGRPVVFLIGGPDGLAPAVDARAELRWSLSALTLPHGLVRVVVAEALYRAVSVLRGHPYHRG